MYHIFYCCYSTDLQVSHEEPIEVKNKEKVVDFALDTLREPEDLFGIIDANDMTCQFYVEENGEVWVEIPVPDENGSYGKYIPLLEVAETIEHMTETFSLKMLPGLKFQTW